jgi:hypothetical protein
MNGTYVPGWDNKLSISTPCSSLIRYSFKATTVTGGVVETPVFNLACRSGAWR